MSNDLIDQAMRAAASCYGAAPRSVQGYVRGKFSWDPVYRQIAHCAPFPSPIIDAGCGQGQLMVLLATLQPGLEGLGLDWDAGKLEGARAGTAGLTGFRIEQADLHEYSFQPAGTIFLIDVLHYLAPDAQDAVLQRAVAALLPGGRLYLRDVDRTTGLRSLINRWQEQVGRLFGLHKGQGLHFRPVSELTAVLTGLGLEVSDVPSWGRLPLSNRLVEARKPSAEDSD